MTLSLRKTRQQVSGSPCRAQETPSPMAINLSLKDQPESQGSSKPSDMPPSTSIFPHEKLQVFTDKVYTISMQYEV